MNRADGNAGPTSFPTHNLLVWQQSVYVDLAEDGAATVGVVGSAGTDIHLAVRYRWQRELDRIACGISATRSLRAIPQLTAQVGCVVSAKQRRPSSPRPVAVRAERVAAHGPDNPVRRPR